MKFYPYSSAASDVLAGLSQAAQARNAIEIQKGEDAMDNEKKEFARRYALQGLQDQLAQRQRAQSLDLTRMQGVFGGASNLLRGLFD